MDYRDLFALCCNVKNVVSFFVFDEQVSSSLNQESQNVLVALISCIMNGSVPLCVLKVDEIAL